MLHDDLWMVLGMAMLAGSLVLYMRVSEWAEKRAHKNGSPR